MPGQFGIAACAAALIVLVAVPAAAAPRQVVLIQSFDRGNAVLDEFTSTLRRVMTEQSPEPLTFIEFVVSPSGFREIPERAMVDYLRSAFVNRSPPDLVITAGGPAAAFARRNRAQLFPDVPVVYGAIDQRFLRGGSFSGLETAVAVANDPTLLVNDVLQLFPETENLFVILGAGEFGRFWRPELQQAAERFRTRLTFIWPDGLTYAGILQRASMLPPRSAILFVSMEVDAQGSTNSSQRALADLHAKANAPVFGAQSSELGLGLIGGMLMSIDRTSRSAADAALRILSGTVPGSIATPIQQPGPPTFDWRELRRWNVPEDRLPIGSVLLFRQQGIWDRFKWLILSTTVVLLVQAGLITSLLVQRRRRERAEQMLRESEERFRVLANSAPVLIRMSGADARFVDFNATWLEFTGRSLESEQGTGWLDGVHPKDLDGCRDAYGRAVERREHYRLEYRLRRADGSYRWLLESGEPRFTPDGSYVGHIGSAIDITDLKTARAMLSNLNRRLIQAQEYERSRVARELHDDVCQRIVTLGIDLYEAGETLPQNAADIRVRLHGLYDEVQELGRDINRISHRLHSFKLGVLGLTAAARTFCEDFAGRHRVTVEFDHDEVPMQLADDVGITLFRVLQEALSNAVRHAGATRYRVRLQGTGERVQLEVVDDGKGFDVATVMATSGLGLMSMQERVALVGGDVSIESAPGTGTTIRVWVPRVSAVAVS
jgi:PAS domain S-box-containing protein